MPHFPCARTAALLWAFVACLGLGACSGPPKSQPTAGPLPAAPIATTAPAPTVPTAEDGLLDPLEPASGPVEVDLSGDGKADVTAFAFLPEEVQPLVWMTQRLAFVPAMGGEAYSEQLDLLFSNSSGMGQHFELEYEIPKDFASHIDEVTFSQEPIRVVNPDPVVVFGVTLPAVPVAYAGAGIPGQAATGQSIRITRRTPRSPGSGAAIEFPAMNEAANIMEKQCQKKPADQQTDCWLQWVASFSGFLSVDRLKAKCALTPGIANKICLALAEEDPTHCITASDVEGRDFCRLYWVRARCRLVEPAQKQSCIFNEALKAQSSGACGYLKNADDRNYCLAVVKQLESYCADIQNLDRRALCVKAVQTSKGQAVQPPADANWFDVGSAKSYCDDLARLMPGYFVSQSSYGKKSLSCGFKGGASTETDCHAKIWGYATVEEALEYWTEEWGPRSFNRKDADTSMASRPEKTTFVFDAASHLLVERIEADKGTYYYIQAAALYKKSVIEFIDYHAESGSTAGWRAVLAAARGIVDANAGK